MTRHAAIMHIPFQVLLEWLDFSGGDIRTAHIDWSRLDNLSLIIEHPDLPEVQEANELQVVTPAYKVHKFGNRIDPPKGLIRRLWRRLKSKLPKFPSWTSSWPPSMWN